MENENVSSDPACNANGAADQPPQADLPAEQPPVEPQPEVLQLLVVPATIGMLLLKNVPTKIVNGEAQAASHHMLNFLPGDIPDFACGEYCMEERAHAWLLYRRDETGKYVHAGIGEKPGFIEHEGKPVMRWHAPLCKWCLTRLASDLENQEQV